MDSAVQVTHDRDVDAVYIKLRSGSVDHTVEVEPSIYMDMDSLDQPLGIEFLHSDDVASYVERHGKKLGIPQTVANQREWATG